MPITTGSDILASDFINESERNTTASNDEGRGVKLESDGKLGGFFTGSGATLNAGATINGATLPVPVYQNKTDNELYACDANDLTKLKFIGFATSNSTDGNPIKFQATGVVSGFTALDEGEKYYVQDTAGTIGTTAGTYPILVGIAISTTQLMIQKGVHRRNGTVQFSDAGSAGQGQSSAVTLGFRPAVIRMVGTTGTDTSGERNSIAWGTWINSVYASAYTGVITGNSTSDLSTTAIVRLKMTGAGTDYWTVTITSVTDTGFTISVTQNDNSPTPVFLAWEAEGEL